MGLFQPSARYLALLEQAEQAPLWRRLIGRALAVFCLVGSAFALGGVIEGYPVAASLRWGAAHAGGIALIGVLPVSAIEPVLPKSRVGVLLSCLLAVAAWGSSLLAGRALFELHHGLAGAVHEASHLLEHLDEPRPWVLVIGPGVGIGLASAWRRQRSDWTWRVVAGLGVLLFVGLTVVAIRSSDVGLPSAFGFLLVLALSLPIGQLTHIIFLGADGFSGGVPQGEVPDRGPRPELVLIDRFLVGTNVSSWSDGVFLLLGVTSGVIEYGALLGIIAGIAVWFLAKVAFALLAAVWPQRLEARGDVDRAIDCLRYTRHGRSNDDMVAANATIQLVLLYGRQKRWGDARRELEELGQPARLDPVRRHNLAAAWIQAGEPQTGLELLDGVKGAIPFTLKSVWSLSRAAALLGVGRAEEALQLLEDLPRSKIGQVAALHDNNLAVALLQTDGDVDRARTLAERARQTFDMHMVQGTLGAALAASGRGEEGAALLRPLLDGPPSPPVFQAFRLYWLARAEDDAARMAEAAALEGPWAERARAES